MKLGLGTRIGSYVALTIVSLFSMFPLYWMVASSVRPRNVLLETPPPYFTTAFDPSAYVNIWSNTPFGQMFINSLFISIATTIVTVVFSAMAGHSLARLKFRGKTVLSRECWSPIFSRRFSWWSRCSWRWSTWVWSTPISASY